MTLNKDQATYDNDELARDALKGLIREALAQGSCFAKELAIRVGERHSQKFVQLLHEMLDEDSIQFTWVKGYRL